MEYHCELCANYIIVKGGRHSRVLNNELAHKNGWENDGDLWYCPDHKLKTYTFTATTQIEARSESDAIDSFSNESDYFASKAECECLEEYEEDGR